MGQAEAQLGRLGAMARRLEHAGPGGLAALKAEVLAANFAAQALAQQTRTAAATAQNTEVALHAAQHDARRAVDDFTRDFYERKIFEKDLRFASAEDERAYREREEQRRREIEKAQAEGTPQGDLRALRLVKEQLVDAGAHGADQNPQYAPMLQGIDSATRNLETATANRDAERRIAASQTSAPDVPADVLAVFRDSGMTTGETSQIAHGLTQRDTAGPAPGGRQA